MRLLIVGYGSIGARHARLAAEMGHSVSCVTKNTDCPFPHFESIERACSDRGPEKVILSNITAAHGPTLAGLGNIGFRGDILVEKPLFGQSVVTSPPSGIRVFVAYNLRFHPLIRALRERLDTSLLFKASFYAGQYLPAWRPSVDYRSSYSAKQEAGGGVLRDLSHEIDLALWLCGPWREVAAIGGHFSDLEITSDDVFMLLIRGKRCPAIAVAVNYLDRKARRTVAVNGRFGSAFVDLIEGQIQVNDWSHRLKVNPDETYRAQLSAFIDGEVSDLCSFDEGRMVDNLISSAEIAAETTTWQRNETD